MIDCKEKIIIIVIMKKGSNSIYNSQSHPPSTTSYTPFLPSLLTLPYLFLLITLPRYHP